MTETANIDLRRAMLDAARQLVVEDGYKNLSMRKIAKQVGCSVGTIYLYFKNKDAIFHALIDEGFEQLYNAYRSVMMTEFDAMQRLVSICRIFVEFGLKHPIYYEIMFMHHPTLTERYPKEMYRRARRFLTLTAEIMADCAEAGLLEIDDPLIDATVLWGAMHGITSLIISQRVDAGFDQKALIDKAIHRAINSFRASEQAFVV